MVKASETLCSVPEEPQVVLRNIPDIFQIFYNAQFNTIQHKKYVKEIKKIYHKIDSEAFKQSFTNALHYTFMFGEANGNVDRVLQFIANFCVSVNDDEEFLRFVFEVIFDCVSVVGQGVRGRSCQLLGLLLTALGDNATLDEDICDKILATQLDRLQDIRGVVRCRAVVTLQRLQNPTDSDDPVTRAYIFHMSCDPSAAVRRLVQGIKAHTIDNLYNLSVVLNLAKSSRNLLHVLERLSDVDESVRKAAFLYISSINVTQLKVRQRIHILKVGLMERSVRVKRVMEKSLIPNWLGIYGNNVLELLSAIRLDNLQGAKESASVAALLLQTIFKQQEVTELLDWLPIDPSIKLIPISKLTKQSVLYWKYLVTYFHANADTDNLERCLPELINFTNYVRKIVESPCPPVTEEKEYNFRQYVLKELVNIFNVYDMADEVGRKALQSLIFDSLTGTHGPFDAEIIRGIMRTTDIVLPDVTKRLEFVMNIISEIQEPACDVNPPIEIPVESDEVKMLRARLRVSLNEALEEQEEAVRAQDFGLAAVCKEKVDLIHKKLEDINGNLKEKQEVVPANDIVKEKKTDPETLKQCLIILNMMLDSPQFTSITPVLLSVFQDFELEMFKNVEIREHALQTVALYSMMDEKFASEHKAFFFSQFQDMDNENIIVTALKCIIDIMCIHGIQTFSITKESQDKDSSKKSSSTNGEQDNDIDISSTQDTIIELFLRFMNSESVEYREITVEGFCRLLMAGRLSSPSLVSRLLLLWFNPATEEEDNLRQILGTFFPLFASHVDDAQEQLESAFLPTISTLANAPLNSPLSDIDPETVLKFIIGLTYPTVAPNACNVHSNLCVLIMNTLERGADTVEALLCRALALLTPPSTIDLCQDLLQASDRILPSITDRASYRNVSRFQGALSMTIESMQQRPSENPSVRSVSTISNRSINTCPSIATLNRTSNISNENESRMDIQESNANENNERLSIENLTIHNESRSNFSTPNPRDSISTQSTRVSTATQSGRDSVSTQSTQESVGTRNSGSSDFKETENHSIRRSARKKVPATSNSVCKPTPRAKSSTNKTTSRKKLIPEVHSSSKDKKKATTRKRNAKERKSTSVKYNKKKKIESTLNKKKTGGKNADKHSSSSSSEDSLEILDESDHTTDDETILHTIRHEESVGIALLTESSSEEELEVKIKKKALPNITIPPSSDSSDGLFSNEDD